MSFVSVALTGTVKTTDGVVIANAVVNARLSADITDGVTKTMASSVKAVTDINGDFSLTVPANVSPGVRPNDTFYDITVTYGGELLDEFDVSVSSTNYPSVDLYSLALPAAQYDGGAPGAIFDLFQGIDGGAPDSQYLDFQFLDGGTP